MRPAADYSKPDKKKVLPGSVCEELMERYILHKVTKDELILVSEQLLHDPKLAKLYSRVFKRLKQSKLK